VAAAGKRDGEGMAWPVVFVARVLGFARGGPMGRAATIGVRTLPDAWRASGAWVGGDASRFEKGMWVMVPF
jgi:hypothetical protein